MFIKAIKESLWRAGDAETLLEEEDMVFVRATVLELYEAVHTHIQA